MWPTEDPSSIAGRLRHSKALNPTGPEVSKKNDLVPTYQIGSDQNGPADEFLEREECHRRKKLCLGHFSQHGTVFQLDGPRKPAGPPPVSSRFGAVRDDSVSPGERVIFAYAYDDGLKGGPHDRAVAIIDSGWIRPPHGQECIYCLLYTSP